MPVFVSIDPESMVKLAGKAVTGCFIGDEIGIRVNHRVSQQCFCARGYRNL